MLIEIYIKLNIVLKTRYINLKGIILKKKRNNHVIAFIYAYIFDCYGTVNSRNELEDYLNQFFQNFKLLNK